MEQWRFQFIPGFLVNVRVWCGWTPVKAYSLAEGSPWFGDLETMGKGPEAAREATDKRMMSCSIAQAHFPAAPEDPATLQQVFWLLFRPAD